MLQTVKVCLKSHRLLPHPLALSSSPEVNFYIYLVFIIPLLFVQLWHWTKDLIHAKQVFYHWAKHPQSTHFYSCDTCLMNPRKKSSTVLHFKKLNKCYLVYNVFCLVTYQLICLRKIIIFVPVSSEKMGIALYILPYRVTVRIK